MMHPRRAYRLALIGASLAFFACTGEVESAGGPSSANDESNIDVDGTVQLQRASGSHGSRWWTRRHRTTTTSGSTSTTTPTPAPAPAPQPAPTPAPAPQPAPAPTPSQPPLGSFLWTDSIQSSSASPWGFNQIALEYPIDNSVSGSDAVNLTRVANPLGSGFALKHVATFDDTGCRSQAGIWSFRNDAFNKQVKSAEGIWIAQEWYFPTAISAGALEGAPWLNLWDFHSVGPNGDNRWDTQPGLMLAQDGSMRVRWAWHSTNDDTDWSTLTLPVGQWFDIEMHYVWSSTGATISLWVNGKLVLEQSGVKTKDPSHVDVETYMKFYGSSHFARPGWTPRPAVKYMRNLRMAGQRIWR